MNDKDTHGAKSLDWEKICQNSSKVITFIDLAGHEKYLKTTVFGMTGHVFNLIFLYYYSLNYFIRNFNLTQAPDFCMLMVISKRNSLFKINLLKFYKRNRLVQIWE
jgi:hypothetical protein